MKRKLTVISDGIPFFFKNVPEKKYQNCMKQRLQKLDTKTFKAVGFPFRVQLEPTNMCNLGCPLCPVGSKTLKRDPRHMKLEEFKRFIDDMGQYLLLLILWDWGEPFMNPEFPEMIKYASSKGIKTITSTNAHFLRNEEYLERILSSGLSVLIVAIDSLNEKKYTVYRKNGQLKTAVEGLKRLVAIKKRIKSKTLINLRMVVMKQTEPEIKRMKSFAKKIGADIFSLKTLNPSLGPLCMNTSLFPKSPKYNRYKLDKKGQPIRKDTFCTRPFYYPNIFSNGHVALCCYDSDGGVDIGNINDTPMTQLWNSEKYRNVRKMLYQYKKNIPMCENCPAMFEHSGHGHISHVYYLTGNPISRIWRSMVGSAGKLYIYNSFINSTAKRVGRIFR